MPPTYSIYKYLLIQIPGFKLFATHALFINYIYIYYYYCKFSHNKENIISAKRTAICDLEIRKPTVSDLTDN